MRPVGHKYGKIDGSLPSLMRVDAGVIEALCMHVCVHARMRTCVCVQQDLSQAAVWSGVGCWAVIHYKYSTLHYSSVI